VESLFAEPVAIPFRLNDSRFVGCGNHFHWDCEFVPSSALLQLGKRWRSETASGRNGERARALRESEVSRGPRGFWVLLQTRAYGTNGSTCSHIGRMDPKSPIRGSSPRSPFRLFAPSPFRLNRSALENDPNPARYARSG
jgi:hypothetical protein